MADSVGIYGFPGYYISTGGVVTNRHDKIILSHPNQSGNMYVHLYKEGRQFTRSLSKLVADAWLGKPSLSNQHFNTPIHLNGDRTDCRVANLAWRPRWFAIRYQKERDVCPNHNFPHRRGRIINLKTGEEFDTICEAAMSGGYLEHDIYFNSLNNHHMAVFPYAVHFRYID